MTNQKSFSTIFRDESNGERGKRPICTFHSCLNDAQLELPTKGSAVSLSGAKDCQADRGQKFPELFDLTLHGSGTVFCRKPEHGGTEFRSLTLTFPSAQVTKHVGIKDSHCTRVTRPANEGKHFMDKLIDITLQTLYCHHLPALKMCTLPHTNVHTVTLSRGVGVGKLSLIHSSFGGRRIRTHP